MRASGATTSPPTIAERAACAKLASRATAMLPTATKDAVILALAGLLASSVERDAVLAANGEDMRAARDAGNRRAGDRGGGALER